jgi:hypothetical protein
VLLHLVDISHPNAAAQCETVLQVSGHHHLLLLLPARQPLFKKKGGHVLNNWMLACCES